MHGTLVYSPWKAQNIVAAYKCKWCGHAEIGLERVKGGLEKGLGSKKRGWELIILHYVIPQECLSCMEKYFPSSAILIQLQSYRLTGHTYVTNKNTISLVKGLSSCQRWSMHPWFGL